jgi:hypothetical protein
MPRGSTPPLSRYTAAYYDRWYRDPETRVRTPATIARLAGLTVSAAEYVLDRPVRTVLDVGAGEGHWRGHLRRLRPRLRYVGSSPARTPSPATDARATCARARSARSTSRRCASSRPTAST